MELEQHDYASISLALLDRHQLFRDGIESIFDNISGLSVVGSVAVPSELSTCLSLMQVDVAIVGMVHDSVDVFECIRDWSRDHPKVHFLVLSQFDEAVYAPRALKNGAKGYLMKDISSAELVESIWRIAGGDVVLGEALGNSKQFTSGGRKHA